MAFIPQTTLKPRRSTPMKKMYVRQSKTNNMNQPVVNTIEYNNGFISMCEDQEYYCGHSIDIILDDSEPRMSTVVSFESSFNTSY